MKNLEQAKQFASKQFAKDPKISGVTIEMAWGQIYVDRNLNCWDPKKARE